MLDSKLESLLLEPVTTDATAMQNPRPVAQLEAAQLQGTWTNSIGGQSPREYVSPDEHTNAESRMVPSSVRSYAFDKAYFANDGARTVL